MVAAPPVEQFSLCGAESRGRPPLGLAVRHRRVEAQREIELTLAPVTKLQGYEGEPWAWTWARPAAPWLRISGIFDVEEIEVVEGRLNEGSLISTAIGIQQMCTAWIC